MRLCNCICKVLQYIVRAFGTIPWFWFRADDICRHTPLVDDPNCAGVLIAILHSMDE
jgi:hypothetical protein